MHRFSLIVIVGTLLGIFSATIISASPVISDISRDIVANVGEDVQFNCTVENIGRSAVSWSKPGSGVITIRNTLSLSDPRYTVMETFEDPSDKTGTVTYSLKITKIEASDMGLYECEVITSLTQKTSRKLNLLIRHRPIIDVNQTPGSVCAEEGKVVNATCYAIGYPQPTITWSRVDGGIMPAGGNSLSGPTLYIKNVHRLDRGGYYCTASNDVDQPAQFIFRIDVEFRPQIAIPRPKIAQVLDHEAELECVVQAYPAPIVVWYRNGTKLQSDSDYEISNTASSHETTTSVLLIDNVEISDFGDYYCNATNKLGHADARLHLFQPVIPVPSHH